MNNARNNNINEIIHALSCYVVQPEYCFLGVILKTTHFHIAFEIICY